MYSFGKSLPAAFKVLALSGTLLVPSPNLFASAAQSVAPAPGSLSSPLPVAPEAVPVVDTAPASAPAAESLPAPTPAPHPRAAAGRSAAPQAPNEGELACLARVILYEAGGESRAGQVAVAQVVMNRVRSPRFPDTVCSVIYQPGQFSSIRSYRTPGGARWQRATALAREVMTGSAGPAASALYFHATRVQPAFARARVRVAQIGNHVFYR